MRIECCSLIIYWIDNQSSRACQGRNFQGILDGIFEQRCPKTKPLELLVNPHHPKQHCGNLGGGVSHEPSSINIFAGYGVRT